MSTRVVTNLWNEVSLLWRFFRSRWEFMWDINPVGRKGSCNVAPACWIGWWKLFMAVFPPANQRATSTVKQHKNLLDWNILAWCPEQTSLACGWQRLNIIMERVNAVSDDEGMYEKQLQWLHHLLLLTPPVRKESDNIRLTFLLHGL